MIPRIPFTQTEEDFKRIMEWLGGIMYINPIHIPPGHQPYNCHYSYLCGHPFGHPIHSSQPKYSSELFNNSARPYYRGQPNHLNHPKYCTIPTIQTVWNFQLEEKIQNCPCKAFKESDQTNSQNYPTHSFTQYYHTHPKYSKLNNNPHFKIIKPSMLHR